MIKYRLTADIQIETINESNRADTINFSIPIGISGLLYNREQLLKKKELLENTIKEVIEREK